MRTSLNELHDIEKYLSGNMKAEDATVFQAKLLTNPLLQTKMRLQSQVYILIREYGRKQLRAEMETVHRRLFQDIEHISFREEIYRLFLKPYNN